MTIFGVPSTRQFFKKFKFVVEIQGVAFAGFRSCTDLRAQVAKIEHHEGGSLIPKKEPGRVTFPDVTLSRGATTDLDLWNWMKETIAAGSILVDPAQKRTIDIVQQDRAGTELQRWTLHNCWPVDYKAGDWDNEVDENVITEIILTYDFFDVGGDTTP